MPEIVEGERVIDTAARLTVIVKVRVAFGSVELVAVIVYVRAAATAVGVPETRPVDVLNESPGVFEISGEIE